MGKFCFVSQYCVLGGTEHGPHESSSQPICFCTASSAAKSKPCQNVSAVNVKVIAN